MAMTDGELKAKIVAVMGEAGRSMTRDEILAVICLREDAAVAQELARSIVRGALTVERRYELKDDDLLDANSFVFKKT